MSARPLRLIGTAFTLAMFALSAGARPLFSQQPAAVTRLPALVQQQAAIPSASPAAAAGAAVLPAAVYWKQDLFLIPYQGVALPAGAAAETVRLFVSVDRGVNWQAVCEAKPNVKAFNYRAPGDGEYWFAVRAVDAAGRSWPAAAYQPELRVIIDKTVPALGTMNAIALENGALRLEWSANDPNLDVTTWRLEAQADGSAAWEKIALPAAASSGSGEWRSTTGRRPVAVRVSVSDLAGNTATQSISVTQPPPARELVQTQRPDDWQPATIGTTATAAPFASSVSSSPPFAPTTVDRPETQAWPASLASRAPFRLYESGAQSPSDAATRYGNPARVATSVNEANNTLEAKFAVSSSSPSSNTSAPAPVPSITPLEVVREVSVRRLPPINGSAATRSELFLENKSPPLESSSPRMSSLPAGIAAKQVASRTFELEYHFENLGRFGISRVELWGTRNNGQSWRRYTEDPDLRSPLRVTVEEAGVYGFRIIAEPAGGTPPAPPQPGERPELWVQVDLDRPVAEITAIETGVGNQADQLVIRWRADDDNLDSRPIALYYSSRPVGPWSVIATNLENTGQYAWRLDRYLPPRGFLRLEARDAAGNVGAYQTIEPVSLEMQQPSAVFSAVPTADAAAAAASAVPR